MADTSGFTNSVGTVPEAGLTQGRKAEIEKGTEFFVNALKKTLNVNLQMVALYGSWIEGNYIEGKSDVNMLVISSDLSFPVLEELAPLVQKRKERINISPLFLKQEDLMRLSRVYPIKFFHIKKNYRILQGEDLLKPVHTDWQFFKENVRQEILNIKMKLRRAFLIGSPNPLLMSRALKSFVPQLISLLQALVVQPQSRQFPEDDIFLQLLMDKKQYIDSSNYQQIEEIYSLIFQHLDTLRDAVERF